MNIMREGRPFYYNDKTRCADLKKCRKCLPRANSFENTLNFALHIMVRLHAHTHTDNIGI